MLRCMVLPEIDGAITESFTGYCYVNDYSRGRGDLDSKPAVAVPGNQVAAKRP